MRRLVCISLLGFVACADFDAAVADCVTKGLCVSDGGSAGGGSAGGGGMGGGASGGGGSSGGGASAEGPVFELQPSTLTFGAHPVGSETTLPITLKNVGGTPGTIASITVPPQFGVDAGGCNTLSADAGCLLAVVFKPSTVGPSDGTLVVNHTTGGFAAASLEAVATGTTPSYVLSPAVAHFPETELDASVQLPITVINTGSGRLSVLTPQVRNDVGGTYSLGANGCADASIDTGQSCSFQVRLQPTSEGRVLGTVNVAVVGDGGLPLSLTVLDGGGFVRFPVSMVVAVPANTERDGGAIVAGPSSCSGTCTTWVRRGPQTFTAAPALTAQFQSWGGACSGTTPACTVDVQDGGTIIANFGFPNRIFALRDAGTGDATRATFSARCRAEASAAGLKDVANFEAFVSLGTGLSATPPTMDGTYTGRLGFLRPDGRPAFVSGSDLSSGAAAYPPLLMADGGLILDGTLMWTGSAADHCANWTSTSGTNGQVGNPWLGGVTFADSFKVPCTERHGVYCIEAKFSGPQVQRPSIPVGGRRAFIAITPAAGGALATVGDMTCQTEANAAGLTGTFVALRRIGASLNVTADGGTWYRTDGVQLFANPTDLFTARSPLNWLAPLNRTADAGLSVTSFVWTGGLDGGSAQNCGDWGTTTGTGVVGNAQTPGPANLNSSSVVCSASRSFYCFQR